MKPAVTLVLLALAASAQQQPVSKGFEHFYNLEFDPALVEFERLAAAEPDNPDRHNHVAHAILYREMFAAGALESELVTGSNPFLRRSKVTPSGPDQKRFEEAIARAIDLSQARIQKNPSDVRATYALGVSHGIRANYNFIVRKAWRDALHDATQARKLHNRVTELDPTIIDARLVQGAHDYVVGSLPWHFKMLGFLVGFRGDKDEGIRTLELVSNKGTQNRVEAGVLLAAIYRREGRAQDAIPLLQKLSSQFPRNYLLRFEMVQMYSDLGKKDEALDVLKRMEELKRSSAAGYKRLPYERIYYSRGNLQFWYDDLDGALENLQRATSNVELLGAGTGILAWMRLGQTLDLKGRREEAVEAYKRAISVAPESDTAKESRRYLSSPYRRMKG